MGPIYGLTERTYGRLMTLLGDQGGEVVGPGRGSRGRTVTLVKCTSTEAVGDPDTAGEISYPAEIVHGTGDAVELEDIRECYLTVWGVDGVPGVPVEGGVYLAVLTGDYSPTSDDVDSLPRAFAVEGVASGGGGGGLPAFSRVTLGSPYTITSDDTWEATGLSITVPAAGSYRIVCQMVALGKCSAISSVGGRIRVALKDTTHTAWLSESRVATSVQVVDVSVQGSPTVVVERFTTAGSATVELHARRNSGQTWTSSSIAGSDSSDPDQWAALSYEAVA